MRIKTNLNFTGRKHDDEPFSEKMIRINARYLFSIIGFGIGGLISVGILVLEDDKIDLTDFSYHSDLYHLSIPILCALLATFGGFFFGKKQDKNQAAIQKLFLNQQLLNLIFDNLPVLISYLNPELRYIYVNKTYENWYGISVEDIEGKLAKDIVDEETFNLIRKSATKQLNGETISFENERIFKGERHFVHTTLIPQLGLNNEVLGYFTVAADISELRNREIQIAEQNLELAGLIATKDKFFSIIAHDLINPFTSLLGFSELLFHDFETYDEKTRKTYIEAIFESAHNTFKLLENLLSWARSQQGKIEYNPSVVNLHSLIDDNLTLFNQLVHKKNILLESKLEEDMFLTTDRDLINTVIRNLVSNAIKFTPEGGKVTVSANLISNDHNDSMVEVSVMDTGFGMVASHVDKLFRIESNYSSTGTQGETGTGLGLILCKEFVEKCNGKLSVKSVLGKGSVFTFAIPIK